MEENSSIYARFERISSENLELKDRILGYQDKIHDLRRNQKKDLKEMKDFYEERIAEKDGIIKELSDNLARCIANAAHDGTNTGIPIAATPIGKKKVIPNLRGSTGKNRGGQPGRQKHILHPFKQHDVTETVAHSIEGACALCGGRLIDNGEIVAKDEYDVEIRTVKRRHEHSVCRCAEYGATARRPIPKQSIWQPGSSPCAFPDEHG